jgi:hypothetical protein
MIKVVLSSRRGLARVGLSTLLERERDISVVQTTEGLDAAVVAVKRHCVDVLVVSFDHLREPLQRVHDRPRMPLPSVFITGDTADRAVADGRRPRRRRSLA